MEENFRIEKDSLGEVKVPKNVFYAAQTARAIDNFPPSPKFPYILIKSIAIIKKSCAIVNCSAKKLSEEQSMAIIKAADKIIDGNLEEHFPISIWQTGSGTQTNMNVNEVIAHLASEILADQNKNAEKIHPNDHVNMGQSSNDTFPTAMHIAIVTLIYKKLLPVLEKFSRALESLSYKFKDIIKIGRTHMQDATPLTLGQEFSGYTYQIKKHIASINYNIKDLLHIAQGGTAVGTGINSFDKFDKLVAEQISIITGFAFVTSPNKFEALASHGPILEMSGSLNNLAASVMKIANDIRFLSSGPRCGIGEITIPANEPGSSIMPGKVNPTQCESITMIAAQVMGNHVAVTVGGASGHLELNVFKPLILYNLINSIEYLSYGLEKFTDKCIVGIKANNKNIERYLNDSLMLVTALNQHIGYDNAAKISKHAFEKDISLKESAIELNLVSSEDFDKIVDPKNMIK